MGTTDSELLRECRAGDVDAFGQFYERYREAVLAYFVRRTGDPESAADLMAETFASALDVASGSRRRRLPDKPVAWLFTIAHNLLVDSLRRGVVEARARRRLGMTRVELDDDDLERIVELAEASALLAALRPTITVEDWSILYARIVEVEPYDSMANRLACSQQVVRKRVSRSISRLRRAYADG